MTKPGNSWFTWGSGLDQAARAESGPFLETEQTEPDGQIKDNAPATPRQHDSNLQSSGEIELKHSRLPVQAFPTEKDPELQNHMPDQANQALPMAKAALMDEKVLKPKASTSSLVSARAGNWVPWAFKPSRSSSLRQSSTNTEARNAIRSSSVPRGANEEAIVAEPAESENKAPADSEGDAAKVPESGVAPTVDQQPGSSQSAIEDSLLGYRKKLWSFWNAQDNSGPQEGSYPTRTANKILQSTPSIPLKADLDRDASLDNDTPPGASEPTDDAVLYKAHDSAREFNKINTHKNENFSENVIVPDWNSCLQVQTGLSAVFQSTRTNQGFDFKNWLSYFSHIPSRLGLSSSSTPVPDPEVRESLNENLVPIYERSHKLYGKALARVSDAKKACLPNFPKCNVSTAPSPKRQKTHSEEDTDESNLVALTHDGLDHLLINQDKKKPRHATETLAERLGRIKKILIIGVHGFFPTKMIRPIIGSPKGTSLKFANEAEKAIIRYLVHNDMISEENAHDISIQKIALEKEGKIFDRVAFFFNVLQKWEQELNEADFVFVAAHSQGCVVSIILLAQLIKNGLLKFPTHKRIGILGMAGVNNGPFYGVDKTFFMKAYSAIEHESMTELFELTKFDSAQSLAYKEAMEIIIDVNVKICLVGSINDQLVPLYSSLAAHMFHPNIYRACYIDQASKTPEFVKRLISTCCQLLNTGYFDNNVIKELSPVLAGPFTGGGHSKIYNDGKVYDLGLKFVLDTDDIVVPHAPEARVGGLILITNQVYVKEYNISKIGTNPFILPWCLRGLLFNVEKYWHSGDNAQSGTQVINDLYELFEQWRPDTKALRDLKFRLNGIRASKL